MTLSPKALNPPASNRQGCLPSARRAVRESEALLVVACEVWQAAALVAEAVVRAVSEAMEVAVAEGITVAAAAVAVAVAGPGAAAAIAEARAGPKPFTQTRTCGSEASHLLQPVGAFLRSDEGNNVGARLVRIGLAAHCTCTYTMMIILYDL